MSWVPFSLPEETIILNRFVGHSLLFVVLPSVPVFSCYQQTPSKLSGSDSQQFISLGFVGWPGRVFCSPGVSRSSVRQHSPGSWPGRYEQVSHTRAMVPSAGASRCCSTRPLHVGVSSGAPPYVLSSRRARTSLQWAAGFQESKAEPWGEGQAGNWCRATAASPRRATQIQPDAHSRGSRL